MYGYRQATNENGLMTNLNSISSSLSSIDTAVTRRSNYTTNNKASNDNLLTSRNHSIASTSLLWKGGGNAKDERYSTAATVRNASRCQPGSEIYYNGNAQSSLAKFCLNCQTALNFILVPLLLLTIIRQSIDFLGQIWLQIIINFFTIIIIIVALFGVRQRRLLYLNLFVLWALLGTVWNIIVVCIHTKIRDVGVNEDVLSFYTGATSWWHTNGPGCLPYKINTSIQNSVAILQPNIITGCRLDYHHIESSQAALHATMSFVAALFCCCVISNISKNPSHKMNHQSKTEKPYRLNNLMPERMRVNQDPFPGQSNTRLGLSQTASLRRSGNKAALRSSSHSISSMRSARRRNRQTVDPTLPTPRGSSSSVQRSQKYGSISSRRSAYQRDRRGDGSSLTYGTNSERPPIAGTSNQRTRLSSLSSADYLPSYQPPHSSNANLLSSYGEISSTDSYNNRTSQRGTKHRQSLVRNATKGNTNPTYTGSRSSVCSFNANANNYDDLSYIYGNNNKPKSSETKHGTMSNGTSSGALDRQKQPLYQQNRTNSMKNGFAHSREQQMNRPQNIQAETYAELNSNENLKNVNGSDTMTKSKYGMTSGSLYSFTASNNINNHQSTSNGTRNGEESLTKERNNNYVTKNHVEPLVQKKDQTSVNGFSTNGANSLNSRSHGGDSPMNNDSAISNQSNQIYTNQRYPRYPIYSNQISNGNSETPI